MNTNDVVKLATAYAAGDLAYDGLSEALGGTVADQVVAIVATSGVAGIASKIADGTIELARDIPIVGGVLAVMTGPIGIIAVAIAGITALIVTFSDEIWAVLKPALEWMGNAFKWISSSSRTGVVSSISA